MRKLILFLLVFVSAKVSAQVYQEMPQYGYRANRMAFDSTLQIPTVCGVPTLRSVVKANKNGAIAYDSCNAVFYTYSPKTQTWSAVSGGGGGATDTTSLSNRINLKLNISDTASMLSKYLRKIDTATLSNRIDLKVPYTGATQDVDLGAQKISAQSFQVEGTNGLGHIHFKHQNSDATATGQSTVLYANSNGDLKYKNAGNYYSTLKTQQTADRVYTFQNKSYTIADSSDLTAKLNSNDTASLSSRIDNKQTNLDILQSISFGIKAEPYGVTLKDISAQLVTTTGRLYLYPFNWNVSDSIRGVGWFNRTTLTITANNYNGVAIYSLSGGTLTRLTFTTNNSTFWDGSINTWITRSIAPFFLNKGVYFLGFQVSSSGTVPTIGCTNAFVTGLIEPPSAVNPNGIKINSFVINSTTSPPSSIAMSTATATTTAIPYFFFY